MDDLLTPVKTVKKVQSNINKFEMLSLSGENKPPQLNPTKSKGPILEIGSTSSDDSIGPALVPSLRVQPIALRPSSRVSANKRHRHDATAFLEKAYLRVPASTTLSDNAREILKDQPTHDELVAVLQYLQSGIDGGHDFNIKVTSSKAAQIINVLVKMTIPDIWTNISQKEVSEDESQIKKTILASLCSAAGVGALIAQIKQASSSLANENVLGVAIQVLGDILKGNRVLRDLLQDVEALYNNDSSKALCWQEISALLAGGRVLSTVSQAFTTHTFLAERLQAYQWLGDGAKYTKWLASNIVDAATRSNTSDSEYWKYLSQVVKRGLSLGHRDILVSETYTKLLLGQRALWTPLSLILKHLAPYEQKSFFDSILADLAQRYLMPTGGSALAYSDDPTMLKVIAGAAALVSGIIKNNEVLQEHVEHWLLNGSSSSTMIGLSSRRALIAALGRSEEKLQHILERLLINFGDKVQIQHISILQQEATTQNILLLIGHLSRINVNLLKQSSISTHIMRSISNRLAASIPRPRVLGMIVGTAMSKLVDEAANVIDFGVEELNTEDARIWLGLVTLRDEIGEVTDLQRSLSVASNKTQKIGSRKSTPNATRKVSLPRSSKIIAIEEVSDSTDSEDSDLVPYQKPDSDAEDSEEDPTLINRAKPSAPVYIVDLIKQLQTTEKPDIVFLALRTGPSLIRRKIGFGTELSDNVLTLVTILVNLQEGMSDPELQDLRLQSMIACIVARADLVSPPLAELYFQGDFSISQRITILTAIGLASREVAGFKDDQTVTTEDFPSKRLPAHLQPQLQQQISPITNPIAMLTDTAAHKTIRPMALAAADQVTGPSALKVRTFSSRMEVEKKTQDKAAARTKIIPKNLHKLLTESIYFPLCSRMSLLLSHTLGGSLPNTTILHSSTMRLFLQTLTLVLHTLGPSANLHLPTLTHETLLFLLNIHTNSRLSLDPAILPALLHLILALLDITIEVGVTAQERLVTDFGAQISELVNWSNTLSDKIDLPDAEHEIGGVSWKILAAGIQVKWFEIGKRFQSRMLGLSMDEMDQLAEN